MSFSVLFPAILFVLGFINLICFYTPSKKLFPWLRSLFPNPFSSIPPTKVEVSMLKQTNPTDRRREELKRVFATFDKNGDGFITEQELMESLRNLNMSFTEKEAAEMVARVDANGDGLIDLDEFCVLCESTARREEREGHDQQREEGLGWDDAGGEGELKEAFDVFDRDKDGLISVDELGSVLSSLGLNEGRRVEDCRAMIRKVDEDGDGMVNFDEFKRMMKGGATCVPVF